MKLYHGGITIVEKPQLLSPTILSLSPTINSRTKDFGTGFYVTTDLEQARHWAKIKRTRNQNNNGFVSIYETEENLLRQKELNRLVFKSANRKWLEFVMKNRQDVTFSHQYDIVAGPVANDRVYTTLSLFENKILNITETLNRLKTYKLSDQILFHTDKSLQKLIYIGSEDAL
jgi:hypothetical protein